MAGRADAVGRRLARGVAARSAYERIGEVEYVPAVDAERPDVGMPGELVWGWYQPAADRDEWENRYAVLSGEAVFGFENLSAAAVTSPWCRPPTSAWSGTTEPAICSITTTGL